MVAFWYNLFLYIVSFLEFIVNESLYDGCFACWLIAEQNNFVLDFSSNGHWWDTHLFWFL